MLSSADVFALCLPILKSTYFDPELRDTVRFLISYNEKYNAVPSPEQVFAETEIKFETTQLQKDQIEYCCSEVETFCREKAIEQAILGSVALLDDKKYGEIEQSIRNAISVSITPDIGLNYFDDPMKRLQEKLLSPPKASTGWKDLDHLLNGGIARKEMILFSANSGGGKSIVLANLALNLIVQGYNVAYISLELSQEMIGDRFDAMLTSINPRDWEQHVDDIANQIKFIGSQPEIGSLYIKYMNSGATVFDIRAYLKELQLTNNVTPDLIVVDYLDLLGIPEKVSVDNVFGKDKIAAEQFRNLGNDYNAFLATASQQTRMAVTAPVIHQGHIAGGISKVNTTDNYFSVIMTDAMKAAGEMAFYGLKTRSSDGVGKSVQLKWDNNSLRITDLKKGTAFKFKKEVKMAGESQTNELLDLMDILEFDNNR